MKSKKQNGEVKPLEKVQFFHFRASNRSGYLAKGGVTVCYIPSAKGVSGGVFGVAVCAPIEPFNKKIGCAVSEGKARKNIGLFKKAKTRESVSNFVVGTDMDMKRAHDCAFALAVEAASRVVSRQEAQMKALHDEEKAMMNDMKRSMKNLICLKKKTAQKVMV